MLRISTHADVHGFHNPAILIRTSRPVAPLTSDARRAIYLVVRAAQCTEARQGTKHVHRVELGPEHFQFEVQDDGSGFGPDAIGPNSPNMRRAHPSLSGKLEVNAAPGQGTCVRASGSSDPVASSELPLVSVVMRQTCTDDH